MFGKLNNREAVVPSFENFGMRTTALLAAGVFGGLACNQAVNITWERYSRTGKIEFSAPINSRQALPQDYEGVLFWNVENHAPHLAGEIRDIEQELHPATLAFAEGSVDDKAIFQKTFPNMYVGTVLTDSKHHTNRGGQAIVLLSRSKPEDITSLVFNGPTFGDAVSDVFGGIGKDLVETASASPSVEYTRRGIEKGTQESRVTVAFTATESENGVEQKVRYIFGHVTPYEANRQKQVDANIKFIEKNKKYHLPMRVCFDWNTDGSVMRPLLRRIGLSTIKTEVTSHDHRLLDSCSTYAAGVRGFNRGVTVAMSRKGSDHKPVFSK